MHVPGLSFQIWHPVGLKAHALSTYLALGLFLINDRIHSFRYNFNPQAVSFSHGESLHVEEVDSFLQRNSRFVGYCFDVR